MVFVVAFFFSAVIDFSSAFFLTGNFIMRRFTIMVAMLVFSSAVNYTLMFFAEFTKGTDSEDEEDMVSS